MTTRYEQAMARIDEDARKFQRVMIGAGNCTYEEALAFKSGAKAFDVLKDVLGLPLQETCVDRDCEIESLHGADMKYNLAIKAFRVDQCKIRNGNGAFHRIPV